MTLLSIDPGKRIGWATFNSVTGDETGRGILEWDAFTRRYRLAFGGRLVFGLDQITEVVCEDYIGRPGQKNGGQHFYGPEVLGAVRILAEQGAVPFHRQRAVDVLRVAALQAGYKLPKGHLPDDVSAWLHGRYRLTQLGILRAEPLD